MKKPQVNVSKHMGISLHTPKRVKMISSGGKHLAFHGINLQQMPEEGFVKNVGQAYFMNLIK